MSTFIRLLKERDKENYLKAACNGFREGAHGEQVYDVSPLSFESVPGKPFSYWVSDYVRGAFDIYPPLKDISLVASGTGTLDDFRFLRCWWEVDQRDTWFVYAKGGAYSPIYYDHLLCVNWAGNGAQMKEWIVYRYGGGHWARNIRSTEHYFRPGLTWPRRTNGLSFRILPSGCIFADKGPAVFVDNDDHEGLLLLSCLLNSRAFYLLLSVQLARVELAQSFEVGLVQQTPIPSVPSVQRLQLIDFARQAWSLKRELDSVAETSHAFLLPATLRKRLGEYDLSTFHNKLTAIHTQIDDIAFDLYGFSEEDRQAAHGDVDASGGAEEISDEAEEAEETEETPPLDTLLSWTGGVTFGRFDWRLATGEREVPPEPDPFDPLPAKSPGMLPDGAEPYHHHAGILVDDLGHEHDLPRLMADVLVSVDAEVDEDLRRWLRRDFFKYHLQQYSKSRRKAPIYWPLATASGSYTLWLYYPDLTDQTLFTAVNDFVEPKLKQVDSELANLRLVGTSRSRADEKRLEELSDFRDELADLRDTLLRIAPGYKPNHDDGVQITAAPLWPLFRHRPWQNVLRETWEKLEQGDYDWAHLAMAYWPERVREKCVTDKSLAIAHDLEHLYVELEPAPKKTRGRKKGV